MAYRKIEKCRICGGRDFDLVLDLGAQALTGVFPKTRDDQVASAPLQLIKCAEDGSKESCGLLQLAHSFNPGELYGSTYGYRSGLNLSMVGHLERIVRKNENLIDLRDGDLVIDIGSNDATLLKSYHNKKILLAGVDPTGNKFINFYPNHVHLISDFFSRELIRDHFGAKKKAKIVTSIAMFYDLDDPAGFMQEIHDILDDNGIWVFEQSYMPTMLQRVAYDTVCHEHLVYYGLRQIKWMSDIAGLKLIDVEINDVNGGSICVTAAKAESSFPEIGPKVNLYLELESKALNNKLDPYVTFRKKVFNHRDKLLEILANKKKENRLILGCGASTKGNVILQFCSLSPADIPCISEVNEDKFGSFTPGTLIPIISEEQARQLSPDYFLVLPWHFRDSIVKREKTYLDSGGKLIFPLPNIEIVSKAT